MPIDAAQAGIAGAQNVPESGENMAEDFMEKSEEKTRKTRKWRKAREIMLDILRVFRVPSIIRPRDHPITIAFSP